MRSSSTLRRVVDNRLTDHDTTFADFVAESRGRGNTIEETWIELRDVTGIPVAVRTMYRWIESLEEAS